MTAVIYLIDWIANDSLSIKVDNTELVSLTEGLASGTVAACTLNSAPHGTTIKTYDFDQEIDAHLYNSLDFSFTLENSDGASTGTWAIN